jgi:hypothetical protein
LKFAGLIYRYSWDEVRPVLLRSYPDQVESIEGYEEVYQTLQSISPSQTNMQIIIENLADQFTGEHYVDVSGKVDPQKEGFSGSIESVEGDDFTYAIEFIDWSEWLEMEIETETEARFSDLEIIAHCLWEMTFVGYNREEIREKFEEIKQAKVDIEFQDLVDVDELFDDDEDW